MPSPTPLDWVVDVPARRGRSRRVCSTPSPNLRHFRAGRSRMPVRRPAFPVPAPIGAVVVSYGVGQDLVGRGAVLRCAAGRLAARSRRCSPRSCAMPIPMVWTNRHGWLPTRWPSCRCRSCWTPLVIPASRSASSTRPNLLSACAYWSKPGGAATSALSLLSGSALPVPDAVRTVDLVGAGSGAAGIANRVALAPGHRLLRPDRRRRPDLTRHGVVVLDLRHRGALRRSTTRPEIAPALRHGKTVEALGLNSPAGAESHGRSCRCSRRGPTLSRADALLAHDGLAPDSRARSPGVGRREPPMSRLIFEARRRLAPPSNSQGHHRHRGSARAASGDSAVVAAARDAFRDRHSDRGHDRRVGRHRDAGDLPADLVLPVRAAVGGDRALSRQRQQDAHRGSRRRTGRLPAVPVGGPGQHPDPGRRAACSRAVVPS